MNATDISSVGQEHKKDANMRGIMIAMLAVAAIGFFSPSGVSAAPVNGAVIGEAVAAGQMIEKVRRYRRYPRRSGPYYTYRPYAPSDAETLHQLSQENQQRAQQNVGGWSDIRLKHHITLLGHLDNGLGYYRFRYNGSDKAYVGVMAQEVQSVRPEAVMRGHDGYLWVNYDMLGLRRMTWDQWVASGEKIPTPTTRR
jgi:Chaperone of endosialidase